MSDMKFPHLLESYNEQMAPLPDVEAKFGADGAKIGRIRATAEQTLASYYLANDDQRYREQLQRSLGFWIESWKARGKLGAWDFVLYCCVSLAIEDFDSLKDIMELEVSTDGYVPVTREFYRLHKAILLEESYFPGKCAKTKGEEKWFRALSAIAYGIEPDWTDFDRYWKATRNRTHAQTILQHRNLLKDGMQVLWSSRH